MDDVAPGQVPDNADVTAPSRTATFVDTSVSADGTRVQSAAKGAPRSAARAPTEELVEQTEVPFPLATATATSHVAADDDGATYVPYSVSIIYIYV